VKIPGAERAVVDAAKVRDHRLSPEHPVGRAKAQFFVQLGFERTKWMVLRDQLLLLATPDAGLGDTTHFGQKYVVRGAIRHPMSGATAAVVAVWIILNDEDFPRFVTAYPGAKS
jgi:hypothetical protein